MDVRRPHAHDVAPDTLPVMQWLLDAFDRDPAGWIAVAIAVAAVVLSAVFWKRLGRSIGAVIRGIIRAGRFLGSLRLVRAPEAAKTRYLPPARFDVVKEKGSEKDELILANFGEGSVARDVQIEPYGDDMRLRTSGFWSSIDGGEVGRFKVAMSPSAAFAGMLAFRVYWTDGNGHRQSDLIDKSP
jgi:hypothetical protein